MKSGVKFAFSLHEIFYFELMIYWILKIQVFLAGRNIILLHVVILHKGL